jgi:tetratricopeptide (TPR) repeat protein
VLERAGGNPLYAEEFVRLLADRGHEAGEAVLPETVQALIAARLDTLSPERKSLLQDAAVVGKVFWAGAVAEIGSRDVAQVELALHELALKELVRPARTSSMEGESEYAFWHLLVRDVAYSQIPRAERARRHRAAAAWIERKGGERVGDFSEVLAHHYLQALELAEAIGDTAQAKELAAGARQFLVLAGERALGLDTVQAEVRLAQALELTPRDDPERHELLVRWAEAAFQAGRLRDSVEALEEALTLLRARDDLEALGRALQLRSRVALRLGEDQMVPLAREAIELLEKQPPAPALVDAYGELACAQTLAGACAEAVDAADAARALAEGLGLPEPARALAYRGYALALSGEPSGLEEMERALALFVGRGAGRDAAIVQNNLAVARYPIEGPGGSLTGFDTAIAFARHRGLGESAVLCEANRPGLLVELGRPDEALEGAAAVAALTEASGDAHSLGEVRAVELGVRLARREEYTRTEIEALVEAARKSGSADLTVVTLASAATALAGEAPADARALLAIVEELGGVRETTYYARHLAAMVRVALATRDAELAERLATDLESRYPLDGHALCAARAQLAEHAGDLGEATALYADAAARWQEFGNVPERAHALLGQGRCLLALGHSGAEEPLREAHELFASMGYKSAVAEADALLEQVTPAPAS